MVLPPDQTDWSLIMCKGCGRRLYDDYGQEIKNPAPWWHFWAWGC